MLLRSSDFFQFLWFLMWKIVFEGKSLVLFDKLLIHSLYSERTKQFSLVVLHIKFECTDFWPKTLIMTQPRNSKTILTINLRLNSFLSLLTLHYTLCSKLVVNFSNITRPCRSFKPTCKYSDVILCLFFWNNKKAKKILSAYIWSIHSKLQWSKCKH